MPFTGKTTLASASQDQKAEGVGLVLWGDLKVLMDSFEVNDSISGLVLHMFVDKKYPLSVNLIERMLDHQLEICHGTSSMDLTLSGPRLDADFLVADSKFMKVAFGVGFKMIAVPSSGIVTTSRYVVPTGRVKVPAGRYVVPTGRVKVPAGRYVVPTGKDNVIVSTGRSKVIPAGRTILVLGCDLHHVIGQYESHEIPDKSHEIQYESHEIPHESFEIP
ncbi:hypothetical protein Tco_0366444 [Tanacetum coccineum]